MFRSRYTKSFVITLATLPAVVCVVIMMVNGNVGTGVAVAGAFSLVRFRSVPGSAKEIVMLFLAMGAGLIAGMGYIAFAFLFAIIMCLAFIVYNMLGMGSKKNAAKYKSMRITVPEDLDYTGVFDELFKEYTTTHELVQVKTTNMGSMFRLTYVVSLKDPAKEHEFIDRIRERNGNLEISVSTQASSDHQL
jgi:cbb3-type cytochrome oxidase subunit 3